MHIRFLFVTLLEKAVSTKTCGNINIMSCGSMSNANTTILLEIDKTVQGCSLTKSVLTIFTKCCEQNIATML